MEKVVESVAIVFVVICLVLTLTSCAYRDYGNDDRGWVEVAHDPANDPYYWAHISHEVHHRLSYYPPPSHMRPRYENR